MYPIFELLYVTQGISPSADGGHVYFSLRYNLFLQNKIYKAQNNKRRKKKAFVFAKTGYEAEKNKSSKNK